MKNHQQVEFSVPGLKKILTLSNNFSWLIYAAVFISNRNLMKNFWASRINAYPCDFILHFFFPSSTRKFPSKLCQESQRDVAIRMPLLAKPCNNVPLSLIIDKILHTLAPCRLFCIWQSISCRSSQCSSNKCIGRWIVAFRCCYHLQLCSQSSVLVS